MAATDDQTVPTPSAKPICNHCERDFEANERFYRCEPCGDGDYNVCLDCLLKDDYTSNRHGPEPCFADKRDGRATFIQGPSVNELRTLLAQVKSNPSFKLPAKTKKFFQAGINIDSFQVQDFRQEHRFEAEEQIITTSTRMVDNDYSKYEPLDPEKGEIRMVLLLQGPRDAPVSLAVVRMKRPWTQRDYYALSYCWGALDETRWIGVAHAARKVGEEEKEGMQTQMFSCTANLEIALRALRRRDQTVIIWVDALCINQADLEERAYQVSMMHEIYANAATVCVWLGLSREHALATALVEAISRAREQCIGDGSISADLTELQQVEQVLRNVTLSTPEEPYDRLRILKMLSDFFSDPYFRRVWVLQEVSLGRDIVALAGDNGFTVAVPWSTITFADLYMTVAFKLFKTSISGLIEPWKQFERQTRHGEQQVMRLPILELFAAVCQEFKATDIRDVLFGLLAIGKETYEIQDLSSMVAPDYKKAANEVFIDFTKWCIMQRQDLATLGYVSYMLRDSGATKSIGPLPSWSLSPFPKFDGLGIKLCTVPEFNASASQPIDSALLQNLSSPTSSLSLRGYRLATINQADRMHFTSRWDTHNDLYIRDHQTKTYYSGGMRYIFSQIRGARGKPLSECQTTTPSTSPPPAAESPTSTSSNHPCSTQIILNRVLMALTCNGMREHTGCDHTRGIHRTKWLDPHEMYADFSAHWVEKNTLEGGGSDDGGGGGDPEMTIFCPHVRALLLPLVHSGDADRMSEVLLNASRKVFAVTGAGQVGLCPLGARTGDVVVALFGGRAPFVVRQVTAADGGDGTDAEENGTRWEFIGECMFPDFMDGRVVGKMVEEGRESEVFEIH